MQLKIEKPIWKDLSKVKITFSSEFEQNPISNYWLPFKHDNLPRFFPLKPNEWYQTMIEAISDDSNDNVTKTKDENRCTSEMFTNFWKCSNGRFILTSDVCNEIEDCADKSDEADCHFLIPCTNGTQGILNIICNKAFCKCTYTYSNF